MTTAADVRTGVLGRDAFTDLVIELSPALLAYIARRAMDLDAAPEILNDTLLVAWRKRERLPADAIGARMWLFVVARNCVRNHDRAWNRRRMREGPLSELTEAVMTSADEGGAEVRKLVLDLPDKYRELVMLVHWDGFSIAEAAHMLGLGQSTARTRYARARDRLRAQIDDSLSPPAVS